MCLNEFSAWGLLPVLLAVVVAAGVVWLVDRPMLGKLLSIRFRKPRLPRQQLLPMLAAGLLVTVLLSACVVACLPCRLFGLVAACLAVCLLLSLPRAMQTYVRSLEHTEAHRRYLLANGATHLETIIPSFRRALKAVLLPMSFWRLPLVVGLPLLFLGLLMGGSTVAAALVSVLLLWMATTAASVLACMLMLWMADKWLFDKHDNFLRPGA